MSVSNDVTKTMPWWYKNQQCLSHSQWLSTFPNQCVSVHVAKIKKEKRKKKKDQLHQSETAATLPGHTGRNTASHLYYRYGTDSTGVQVFIYWFLRSLQPRWPSGEGICLEGGRPRVRFLLAPGFFQVESCQWLKNWHSSGNPARHLLVYGQCWDWLAWCQYAVTGWDSLICIFYLSVAARTIVWVDLSLR